MSDTYRERVHDYLLHCRFRLVQRLVTPAELKDLAGYTDGPDYQLSQLVESTKVLQDLLHLPGTAIGENPNPDVQRAMADLLTATDACFQPLQDVVEKLQALNLLVGSN